MIPVRTSRGFTLLEIIVSLAVAALGIAAVAKATGGAATTADETRERMLAVWVADNRLAELNIARSWPSPGQYDATVTMGGRTWYLVHEVSETGLAGIRRVDIEVFTDEGHEVHEYRTFGFVARYQPPDTGASDQEGGGSEQDEDTGIDEQEEIPLPGDEPRPEEDAEAPPQEQEEPPREEEAAEGEG